MSAVVHVDEVTPAEPVSAGPVAHVAVLVSLNFPDMDETVAELVRKFTRVTLESLVRLGASYELLDTSAPLPDPTRAARCDGLLLLGGGDIDGTCYGADVRAAPNSYGVDVRADRDALAAITAAEEADRPVLGICRGAQLLNVHRGGTIIPDIEDYTLHHGAPGQPLFLDERISILPGTRLRTILETATIVARSGHHQAVDVLGDRLRLAAVADDGVVEGFEDPDRWLVGVQWHPEDDDAPEHDRATLFGRFVDACASRRHDPSAPGTTRWPTSQTTNPRSAK